jgi:hypothetical protein
MEIESFDGLEKRQTIEVNRHRMVVQCRGKRNRAPAAQEIEILAKWASEAGLEVNQHVRSQI